MTLPVTVEDVIKSLDGIIQHSIQTNSPLGYFACLYRRMTAAVLQGIQQNKFQDGPRMAQLDVTFADRYLQAYQQYQQKQPTTQAWHVAFEACRLHQVTVFQQLILGINAHINLDLGIAAAQTCPGEAIWALKDDFMKINGVIASLTRTVQDELTQVWFPMRWLDRITGDADDDVINFSIGVAREAAWRVATGLAFLPPDQHADYIRQLDGRVAGLARKIEKPPLLEEVIVKFVRMTEINDPRRVIAILRE